MPHLVLIFQKDIIQGYSTKISEIHIFMPGRHAAKKFFRPKCQQNTTRKSHKAWIHYFHRLNHTVATCTGVGHIGPPPPVVVGLKVCVSGNIK